ncbi:MAG: hypothetical protein AAF235_07025 [Planctomycetota bacterium]
MTTRTTLAIGFTSAALIFMGVGVVFDAAGWQVGLLALAGNVGAEILGLALTVAIIDWLIERKKITEEAHRLAWQMLHDLDHAFWVWQGGRREFHLDELVALLGVADPKDPMPQFTEELFINLGIRASDTLRLQPRLMNHDRRLRASMKSLSGLAQIREAANIVDANYVIDGLRNAVRNLADVTGQNPHSGEFGAARSFRDPSEPAQIRRYRGSLADTIMRDDMLRKMTKTPGEQGMGVPPQAGETDVNAAPVPELTPTNPANIPASNPGTPLTAPPPSTTGETPAAEHAPSREA